MLPTPRPRLYTGPDLQSPRFSLSKATPLGTPCPPSRKATPPEYLDSAHSGPNSTPSPRPSLTGRTFAALFWATRSRWQLLAPVTASTFPSRYCRVPDRSGKPGKSPSRVPAALAPRSQMLPAAGVAVEAAAAPRGRQPLDGR